MIYLYYKFSKGRGRLVVCTLDYESWGREFKSYRGHELLTSKKAANFLVDSALNEHTGYSVCGKVSRRGRRLSTRPHETGAFETLSC